MKKTVETQLLTNNFGISKKTVLDFHKNFGLNTRIPISKLKRQHLGKIDQRLLKLDIGKKLKDKIRDVLNFSIMIRTYRGLRHKFKYPARGQRTHTNAKTKKKFKL
jgi:small subunit ribosomal protein S13